MASRAITVTPKESVDKTPKLTPQVAASKATILENTKREIVEKIEKMAAKDVVDLFSRVGIGTTPTSIGDYFTCCRCGKLKARNAFTSNGEVDCRTGVSPICKDCAEEIANPIINGVASPTKESFVDALKWLRKPFLNRAWEAALNQFQLGKYNSLWAAYIVAITVPVYTGMTFDDSDIGVNNGSNPELPQVVTAKDIEVYEGMQENREEVIKFVGYDPFEVDPPEDKPMLYSQFLGYFGNSEDAQEDMLRTSSIVSIVRSFVQIQQIENKISLLMQDESPNVNKYSTIDKLVATKAKLQTVITNLASASCINLKDSKNASKGDDSWTGRIKKLRELNLRAEEVNGFDIDYCRGMQQAADISNASILKQLRLDEGEMSSIIAAQREAVVKWQKIADIQAERARVLLRENLDLRSLIEEQGYTFPQNTLNLEYVLSDGFEVDTDE